MYTEVLLNNECSIVVSCGFTWKNVQAEKTLLIQVTRILCITRIELNMY